MSDDQLRRCCTCKQTLPLSSFHKDKGDRLGHTRDCKECACERTRRNNRKNPERARAKAKAWYAANAEQVKERSRRWEKDNPEAKRERSRRTARAMRDRAAAGDPRGILWVERRTAGIAKWREKVGRAQPYGIAKDQWTLLLETQGGRCACCRSDDPGHRSGWQTDHDHDTGLIRGILCALCNRVLGTLGDNRAGVERSAAMFIAYLQGSEARIAGAGLSSVRVPGRPKRRLKSLPTPPPMEPSWNWH